MADWRVDVLNGLGAPTTAANLAFLSSWQRWEGGATNNDASFNYLNTTLNAPGAVRSINSVGVKAYDSYAHGIGATVQTLQNGRYAGLLQGLRSGNPSGPGVAAGLSTWLSGSPNSQAGLNYASRVMGTKVDAPPAGKTGLQHAAETAFYAGPAGVAYGPNPQEFQALATAQLLQQQARTQQTAQLLKMSNDALTMQSTTQDLVGLVQARQLYSAASQAAAKATASAALDGGQLTGDVAPSQTDPAVPKAGSKLANAIAIAEQQVGKPYVWGGNTPQSGFDCSGLLDYAFKRAGYPIPGRLTTYSALQLGKSVKGQPMLPGDWLIVNGGEHMVMYVGDGKVIAAPHTGTVVQYQPVSRFMNDITDVRRYAA